jgi:hypothetical protein
MSTLKSRAVGTFETQVSDWRDAMFLKSEGPNKNVRGKKDSDNVEAMQTEGNDTSVALFYKSRRCYNRFYSEMY